jgi:polyisoprenoid-binding protein YceI
MALQTLPIDHARSSIQFSVRHLVIAKVRGRFTRWAADLRLDEEDLPRSRIDVSIEAASIDTNDEARDVYLRSAEAISRFAT